MKKKTKKFVKWLLISDGLFILTMVIIGLIVIKTDTERRMNLLGQGVGQFIVFSNLAAFLIYLFIGKIKKEQTNMKNYHNKEEKEIHAFVSEHPESGISIEEAKALQKEILSTIDSNSNVSQKINAAAKLLTHQLFQESIEAYSKIILLHPEKKGVCYSQIGACYFFLKEYDKAIEQYKLALKHGADESMMNDNIKEAEEAKKNSRN